MVKSINDSANKNIALLLGFLKNVIPGNSRVLEIILYVSGHLRN